MKRNALGAAAAAFIVLASSQCGDNANIVGFGAGDAGPSAGGTAGNASTGGSGSAGTGGAGIIDPPGPPPTGSSKCKNPVDQTSPPTGFVKCDNGIIHRTEVHDCVARTPRPDVLTDAGAGCHRDADCSDKPYGHCEPFANLVSSGFACDYGCVRDADCGAGKICQCGNQGGSCTTASCTVDSQCANGAFCAATLTGCSGSLFACQRSDDECNTSADCPAGSCSGGAACFCARASGDVAASCTAPCVF